jgi:AcrR family transcriptional regulator
MAGEVGGREGSPFAAEIATERVFGGTSPAAQALPPELTGNDQRSRLLNGALAAVAERGYAATAVAHIIGEAGVSRTTFYETFANKEACVLATYDLLTEWLGRQIAAAVEGAESWPEAVGAAVEAGFRALASDPRIAPFCALEILQLGRVGFARFEHTIERLATPLAAGRQRCAWGPELPPELEQTLVGGAIWLLGHEKRLDDPARLSQLVAEITYFLLTPYRTAGDPPRGGSGAGLHLD